jgi:hypothetical protein
VPAAAVIPAPIAYIKVAAVKKLVVGFLVRCPWVALASVSIGRRRCVSKVLFLSADHPFRKGTPTLHWAGRVLTFWIFYFEKIRVFKAGFLAFEYISME